jgi:TolA-binding protein
MGQSFCNNKAELKIVILLSVILLTTLGAYASYKESELFDQGYENYISSQPEKAVEAFRTFLKEFPDSSVKDAAMFWLGKSLIQLYSFEEAKQVFSEIKQQTPESPFIAYLNRETEDISRIEFVVHKLKAELNDTVKTKIALEQRLAEIEKKAQLTEQNLSVAVEDRDKLRLWLEEEKAITEELKARVNYLEGKDAEIKVLLAQDEEKQKDWEKQKDQFNSRIQQLEKDKAEIENEEARLKDMVKEYEEVLAMIKEKSEEDISVALNTKNTLEAKIAAIEKSEDMTEKDVSTTEHPSESETKQERNLIYSVHIALLGKKDSAEALSREYVKKGYDAYVQKAVSKDGKKISYRVLIGKFENNEEASQMAKKISDKEKIKVFIFSE